MRLNWKAISPTQYRMCFICTTKLVETFRRLFPHDFHFEGNRALVFDTRQAVPNDALAVCVAAALSCMHKRR